jgi:transcription termination factor Rho
MAVLDRSELQASPLSDLHAIADQLGLEGFRRMRKAELIDAILSHGSGDDAGREGGEAEAEATDQEEAAEFEGREEESKSTGARTRRSPFRVRRARRARPAREEGEHGREVGDEAGQSDEAAGPSDEAPGSSRVGGSREEPRRTQAAGSREERTVTGVVELLGNGSAFLRVNPPDSSEDDVYISAAQVRRCELVSGDRVSGPLRTPRRSERYPSLVRVETINDAPAGEVADAGRYEDRAVAYASELLSLESGAGAPVGTGGAGASDAVLRAIERLAPFGRGSRVLIAGPPRSGKTTVLCKLLGVLSGRDGLDVTLVLVGVRPEEIAEHGNGGAAPAFAPPAPFAPTATPASSAPSAPFAPAMPAPVAALSFAASTDTQDQAVTQAIETAKRIAARGGDALVLIDTLDGLHPHAARRAMAAARNLRDGGSLTIIATATRPLGGETTVIALAPDAQAPAAVAIAGDSGATGTPAGGLALDARTSGTVRAELLVGEDAAVAIVRARADALASQLTTSIHQ